MRAQVAVEDQELGQDAHRVSWLPQPVLEQASSIRGPEAQACDAEEAVSADVAEEWTPKVLTEYETGHCVSAIEAVSLLGKPLAEVSTRRTCLIDFLGCIDLPKETCPVRLWTRSAKGGRRC